MRPIDFPCMHYPTDEERARDGRYLGCDAPPGQPCIWARRSDGVNDPEFHSERLEMLVGDGDPMAVNAGKLAEDMGLV